MIGYIRRRYKNILSPRLNLKTFGSEAVGTFAFVLMGCGAAALCNAPTVYPPASPRMVKMRHAASRHEQESLHTHARVHCLTAQWQCHGANGHITILRT